MTAARTRRAAFAAAVLVLGGCAPLGPRPAPPALVSAESLAGVGAEVRAPAIDARWWTAFGDPQLTALVDEALAGSPSAEVAAARLDAARAAVVAARAGRAPTVQLQADLTRERLSSTGLYPPPYAGATVNLGNVGVDLGYEIDIVGRVRATIAAADARAAAAAADRDAARWVLAAAVCRAYIEYARTSATAALLADSAARRHDLLSLTAQRARAGLDTELEVEEARAAVAAIDAELAANAAADGLARDELALLVGEGPGRGSALEVPRTSVPQSPPLPSQLPADLLGRRPDVRVARAEVEVSAADVRVARAAFYPDLNLAAFAGFQSVELGSFLSGANRVLGAGPALRLPLFDAGRLRGELGVRDAAYRESVARYHAAVIGAYREVADALATVRGAALESDAHVRTLASFDHTLELLRARQNAGLATALAVLTAEDRQLGERRTLAAIDARRAAGSVALMRALGGGYGPNSPGVQEQ